MAKKTTPVLADFRAEKNDDWHTLVLPLNPSEEPPVEFVSRAVMAAFGHFPLAEARLPLMHFVIEDEDLPTRRLVGRFPKWSSDPPPDMSQFREHTLEEIRKAELAKGKVT